MIEEGGGSLSWSWLQMVPCTEVKHKLLEIETHCFSLHAM